MLKRTHLRHFVALAETGSFTAAARRLNLTQPTLSASISEIERQLGTSLIFREHRGIRLTDAGHQFFIKARSVEREFRAAETMLIPARPQVTPLVLGVLASISTSLLIRLRANFGDTPPLVLIEGNDADLRRRLSERQIDVALSLLRESETEWPSSHLLSEHYAVLLSSGHSLAQRSQLGPEELSGETMLARRSCEILAETSKFFTARGVRPNFLIRTTNDDRCLALVREGFAITTGPASLATNGIVAVPMQGYNYRRRVGLILRDREQNEKLSAALAMALTETNVL